MTLDEAIKHAEEVAVRKDDEAYNWEHDYDMDVSDTVTECKRCADEHRQLAEWLKDYKRLLEQQPCEDCVSREQAKIDVIPNSLYTSEQVIALLDNLPPVTPTHGTCKDCKHWKDSDGVYRRGVGAESKCPINIKEVYEGNFYCKRFKERGGENE